MTKENFNKRIILWKLVRHYWSDNSKFIGLRRFTFCRNISIWLFLASSTFLFLHRNDQKLCKIYFNWIRNITKDIYSKIRYVQFKGFLTTSITCALLACFNFHNVHYDYNFFVHKSNCSPVSDTFTFYDSMSHHGNVNPFWNSFISANLGVYHTSWISFSLLTRRSWVQNLPRRMFRFFVRSWFFIPIFYLLIFLKIYYSVVERML